MTREELEALNEESIAKCEREHGLFDKLLAVAEERDRLRAALERLRDNGYCMTQGQIVDVASEALGGVRSVK